MTRNCFCSLSSLAIVRSQSVSQQEDLSEEGREVYPYTACFKAVVSCHPQRGTGYVPLKNGCISLSALPTNTTSKVDGYFFV